MGGTGLRAMMDHRPTRTGVNAGAGDAAIATQRHDFLPKSSPSHAVQEEVGGMVDENKQIVDSLCYLQSYITTA